MKRIIMCYNCRKPVRLNHTYTVSLTEDIHAPLTGDHSKNKFITKLCPICTKDAGYKVNKEKLQKHLKTRGGDY